MILRSIRRAFRRAKSFVKDTVSTVKKTVSKIAEAPFKAAEKVLGKFPMPKLVKQFAGAFLNSPFAAMLPAPVAGLAAMVAGAEDLGDLVAIARSVTGSAAYAAGSPAGRSNVLELMAAQQARIMFPGLL